MLDFLFMAPFSQELEPPQNPGRFNVQADHSRGFLLNTLDISGLNFFAMVIRGCTAKVFGTQRFW
ncbi:hypothetical protein C6P99_19980 [Burkholderia multivorans]|uniref:Bacteriophage protein n=1 Tax=Burkholderia multivorans TaxID=87883 RepID=A0AB37APL3_9BURK|nr:hypothetical protein C6P99_19980 [Burkholderia multivorans]